MTVRQTKVGADQGQMASETWNLYGLAWNFDLVPGLKAPDLFLENMPHVLKDMLLGLKSEASTFSDMIPEILR